MSSPPSPAQSSMAVSLPTSTPTQSSATSKSNSRSEDPTAAKAFLDVGVQMEGNFRMVETSKIVNLLPQCANQMPEVGAFNETEYKAKDYTPFISYMTHFLAEKWKFVSTDGHSDSQVPSFSKLSSVKPDIILYGPNYDPSTEGICNMAKAELFAEFKE
ncbi:hypothetical protein BT69DRAFT_1322517, partial [Atractiella rhizophila]